MGLECQAKKALLLRVGPSAGMSTEEVLMVARELFREDTRDLSEYLQACGIGRVEAADYAAAMYMERDVKSAQQLTELAASGELRGLLEKVNMSEADITSVCSRDCKVE